MHILEGAQQLHGIGLSQLWRRAQLSSLLLTHGIRRLAYQQALQFFIAEG